MEKGTYLMTNSVAIAKIMAKRCQGGHRHVHLIEGRAAAAAKYTEEFCKELCRGLIEQKKADANEVVMIGSLSWEEQSIEANPSGPLSTRVSGSQLLKQDGKKNRR